MGKRVDAVKPELERYASLVQQIKEKSKERRNLLAEKKETPFYLIPKLHDLTHRITELTEEIEELKTEKDFSASFFGLRRRCGYFRGEERNRHIGGCAAEAVRAGRKNILPSLMKL